ncbi:MAG: prephenate dehydrogenase/arogenate dehydrogenase family protein, partial [Candidatus Sumerlaeia bacterium]|nr:prephenate dehydrogenase/arogenate dehydrogenase family protein [Candidatus Sumerlaeia bacterium]
MFETITIIGVGLIGGSIGLAVKKNGLVKQVIGVGRNSERLKLAQDRGAIDNFTTDIARGVKESQLVILGLPVEKIIEALPEVAGSAPEWAIVTDVGSTCLLYTSDAA